MPGEPVHFEIFVEDYSGMRALDFLIPKILADEHTFRIHPYSGIGRLPGNMRDATDPRKRALLTNLPKLLKGCGRTFQGYGPDYKAVAIVVCDLDKRNRMKFLRELEVVLSKCNPKPPTCFCLAIEEGEAWLLGDLQAIRAAYPNVKNDVLESYVNDSICGTWEVLANAVYPGGERALSRKGWHAVGHEKITWAEAIARRMDVDANASPSFCSFRDTLRSL